MAYRWLALPSGGAKRTKRHPTSTFAIDNKNGPKKKKRQERSNCLHINSPPPTIVVVVAHSLPTINPVLEMGIEREPMSITNGKSCRRTTKFTSIRDQDFESRYLSTYVRTHMSNFSLLSLTYKAVAYSWKTRGRQLRMDEKKQKQKQKTKKRVRLDIPGGPTVRRRYRNFRYGTYSNA